LPVSLVLDFLLLKYLQRQKRETTAIRTTIGTTTAMTIVIVLLLSAKTRIVCG